MMTDQEKELLRLLALKMSWPRNGGRDEFDTDVKLDRAIDRAMVRLVMLSVGLDPAVTYRASHLIHE